MHDDPVGGMTFYAADRAEKVIVAACHYEAAIVGELAEVGEDLVGQIDSRRRRIAFGSRLSAKPRFSVGGR